MGVVGGSSEKTFREVFVKFSYSTEFSCNRKKLCIDCVLYENTDDKLQRQRNVLC